MTKPTIGDSVTIFTNPPDGVVCGSINQFMLLSLVSDELTLQWCAIGNPSDWPTPATDDARSKQAGSQKFNGKFGVITGIAGGDFFGYVFQQRAITKVTYVGGDIVFAFDTFEEGRGCFEYNRFVQIDDAVFFESEFGRHVLVDGAIEDIGHGTTDDTFAPSSSLAQKTVAVNPGIHTVFFEDGNIAYNYKTGQWTEQSGFLGRTYYSIDSDNGIIGQVVQSGKSFDLQTSEGGVVLSANFETGERDFNPGGRTTITGVRPLIRQAATGTSVQVRAAFRAGLTEHPTYTTLVENTRSGMWHGRVDGRYGRIWMQVSGGFETVMGADVDFTPSGLV